MDVPLVNEFLHKCQQVNNGQNLVIVVCEGPQNNCELEKDFLTLTPDSDRYLPIFCVCTYPAKYVGRSR